MAKLKKKELWTLIRTSSTKVLQLYKGIKKPVTTFFIQIKTRKIGLYAFLFAHNLANNSKCKYGHKFRIVQYISLDCHKFTWLKREMWTDVQRKELFEVIE